VRSKEAKFEKRKEWKAGGYEITKEGKHQKPYDRYNGPPENNVSKGGRENLSPCYRGDEGIETALPLFSRRAPLRL